MAGLRGDKVIKYLQMSMILKKEQFATINERKIGATHPPYVIVIPGGVRIKLQKALDTISKAKTCGADAIKLQTYTADTMTIDSDYEDFYIQGGLWDGYTLYDLYKEAGTPFEWHKTMFDHARKIGITCFSTPFDETAVDLLEDLNAPAYKVASFEMTDLPLIKYIASTKKPLIISTGMANLEEIKEVVITAREAGCKDLLVLHCLSSYPAPIEQSNLLTIPDLSKKLGVQIGLSDHTVTNTASIVAVSLGATLIEKHFTLDNITVLLSSLNFRAKFLVANHTVILFFLLHWNLFYERKPAEEPNIKFRRSVYFVKDIRAGEVIKQEHIRRIRPGFGLHPKEKKIFTSSKKRY